MDALGVAAMDGFLIAGKMIKARKSDQPGGVSYGRFRLERDVGGENGVPSSPPLSAYPRSALLFAPYLTGKSRAIRLAIFTTPPGSPSFNSTSISLIGSRRWPVRTRP